MTEHKFVRVSDRLYEEYLAGDSSPVKWAKRPELLHLELYDVVAEDGAEFPLALKDDPDTGDIVLVDPLSELRAIKQITAKGKIIRDRGIGLIGTKGPTSRVSAKNDVSVRLLAVAVEELGKRHGSLILFPESEVIEESHLSLEMLVPKTVFDEAWTEICTGVAKRVVLGISVEVFLSELERSLGDPRMPQVYYIEYIPVSAVMFSSLVVSSAPIISLPAELQNEGEKPSVQNDTTNRPRSGTPWYRDWRSMLMGGLGMVAIALVLFAAYGIQPTFDLIREWLPLVAFLLALYVVLPVVAFALFLGALYLVVRVTRAAWKRGGGTR